MSAWNTPAPRTSGGVVGFTNPKYSNARNPGTPRPERVHGGGGGHGGVIGTWNRAAHIVKRSHHQPVPLTDRVFDFGEDVMSVYSRALKRSAQASQSSPQASLNSPVRASTPLGTQRYAVAASPSTNDPLPATRGAALYAAAAQGVIVPRGGASPASGVRSVAPDGFLLPARRTADGRPDLSWAIPGRGDDDVSGDGDEGPESHDGSGDEGEVASRQLHRSLLNEASRAEHLSREAIAMSLLGDKDPLHPEARRNRQLSGIDALLTHDHKGHRLALGHAAGPPKFVMTALPLHPAEEAIAEKEREEQRSWRWQWHLEKGHEIPLTLLLLRGVEPRKLPDLVAYHMHPELLRDVAELQKGSYLAKFQRRGGASHERFFSLAMLQPSASKPPVPMLVWKLHANAHSLLDRVPLSGLVGVSFDAESITFNHYKVLANGTPLVAYLQRQRDAFQYELWQWQTRNVALPPERREPEPVFRPQLPPATEVFLKGPVVGGGKHQYLFVRNAFTLWFLDRRTMTPSCVDVCAYDRPTASLWAGVLRALCAINSVTVRSHEIPRDEMPSVDAAGGDEGDHQEVENQAELLEWVQRELQRYYHEGDPLLQGLQGT